MSIELSMPLAEVTCRGIAALVRELGPVDTARFIAQFSGGTGDYTVDRVAMFAGEPVSELSAKIRAAIQPPGALSKERS